jgi:mRNA-degrading endonuclease YafQ of YafQ-DinJ toxin-antitoxin module
MRVALTERLQADVLALPEAARAQVFQAMLALPKALGQPHLHTGLGLRKIHPSGIWEVRVGLGLRLLFTLAENVLTFVRAGTHDDVRRYLRTL